MPVGPLPALPLHAHLYTRSGAREPSQVRAHEEENDSLREQGLSRSAATYPPPLTLAGSACNAPASRKRKAQEEHPDSDALVVDGDSVVELPGAWQADSQSFTKVATRIHPGVSRPTLLELCKQMGATGTSGMTIKTAQQFLREFSAKPEAWSAMLRTGARQSQRGSRSKRNAPQKDSAKRLEELRLLQPDTSIQPVLPTERSKDTRTPMEIEQLFQWVATVTEQFPDEDPRAAHNAPNRTLSIHQHLERNTQLLQRGLAEVMVSINRDKELSLRTIATSPPRLLVGGPPSRLLLGASPSRLLLENGPQRNREEAQPSFNASNCLTSFGTSNRQTLPTACAGDPFADLDPQVDGLSDSRGSQPLPCFPEGGFRSNTADSASPSSFEPASSSAREAASTEATSSLCSSTSSSVSTSTTPPLESLLPNPYRSLTIASGCYRFELANVRSPPPLILTGKGSRREDLDFLLSRWDDTLSHWNSTRWLKTDLPMVEGQPIAMKYWPQLYKHNKAGGTAIWDKHKKRWLEAKQIVEEWNRVGATEQEKTEAFWSKFGDVSLPMIVDALRKSRLSEARDIAHLAMEEYGDSFTTVFSYQGKVMRNHQAIAKLYRKLQRASTST
ncbi:hypothetical protein GGX14DRAFT_561750 [Mycena pura]|uniref:Uncharacterized protein n=1 Tax=Mycena pura TaxID=153505 RepID=A0AAD6VMC3_9AGAR|nr:hypothetical protein GGX14DRAFT_561750 [Mycena pura]